MKREHVIFNANIIVAGLIALTVATQIGTLFNTLFAQNELTSLISTISHFVIYIILNSTLHFFTNRKKYNSVNKKFFADLGKLYGTQLPTFALYYGLYFGVNDLLLHMEYSATISNITAWIVGTLSSRIVHTYLAHKAGLFKE